MYISQGILLWNKFQNKGCLLIEKDQKTDDDRPTGNRPFANPPYGRSAYMKNCLKKKSSASTRPLNICIYMYIITTTPIQYQTIKISLRLLYFIPEAVLARVLPHFIALQGSLHIISQQTAAGRGDILINGNQQSIESLKPVIGFVPQERFGFFCVFWQSRVGLVMFLRVFDGVFFFFFMCFFVQVVFLLEI